MSKVSGRNDISNGIDSVTDILSNGRRRRLIRVIEEGEILPLGEAAERVARKEVTGESVSATERKRVYIAFHQCHLPRMNEHNVVEYDKDRKTIEAGKGFQDTKRALERLESLFS